jgi:hypothetical protein
VFRATVLAIVFSLAIAPEAMLLCRVWCPDEVTTSSCHHHERAFSKQLQPADDCDAEELGVAAFIPADGYRALTGVGVGHAAPIPHYQLARPTSQFVSVDRAELARALANRPLERPLRL